MRRTILKQLALILFASPLSALAGPKTGAHRVCAKETARVLKRWDAEVILERRFTDPYDPEAASLDLVITTPSGATLAQPAYFVSDRSGTQSIWQARFTPREPGLHRFVVRLLEHGAQVDVDLAGEFDCHEASGKGFLSVQNVWSLKFDDGTPFRGVGQNFCWEARDVDDSRYFKTLHEDKRFNYEHMFEKLAASGVTFIRTWMIYWNLPVDWKWVDNNVRYRPDSRRFNASGAARMDQVVALAERYGIYLMLALESHVGFMGKGWDNSVYNARNGGAASTPAEFFQLPGARRQYKAKLRYFVARWGYSPSIAMCEFFNEIDNVMYSHPEAIIPDSVITSWHAEMSAYLKSIDPYKHLITTSVSHRDVEGLNDVPDIDVNQRHIYKSIASIPDAVTRYSTRHRKPYVIGEAAHEWDWTRNFDTFEADMISDFKRQLWFGLFSPTPVTPLSWWWEYFDEKGLTPYFSGVQQINKLMLFEGNGAFKQLAVGASTENFVTLAITAGRSVFIYAYNASPASVNGEIAPDIDKDSTWSVTTFEPDTRTMREEKGSLSGGALKSVRLGPQQDRIFILRRREA